MMKKRLKRTGILLLSAFLARSAVLPGPDMMSAAAAADPASNLFGPVFENDWPTQALRQKAIFRVDAKTGLPASLQDSPKYIIDINGLGEQARYRLWNSKKEEYVKGRFEYRSGKERQTYYFDPDTRFLQTGDFEIPVKNIPGEFDVVKARSIPGPLYGALISGRMKLPDGRETYYRDSDQALVKDGFYVTPEGMIYANQDGVLMTGVFTAGEDYDEYETDENGIIQRKNGVLIRNMIRKDQDKIILYVKDREVEAGDGTLLSDILKAASPAIRSAIYHSAGRDDPKALDCLGFSLFTLNHAFDLDLEGKSVNSFVKEEEAGKLISKKKRRPGDIIVYRATTVPRNDLYTHAAIYLGNDQVLSMGQDGVSLIETGELKNYNGDPAKWEVFRPYALEDLNLEEDAKEPDEGKNKKDDQKEKSNPENPEAKAKADRTPAKQPDS